MEVDKNTASDFFPIDDIDVTIFGTIQIQLQAKSDRHEAEAPLYPIKFLVYKNNIDPVIYEATCLEVPVAISGLDATKLVHELPEALFQYFMTMWDLNPDRELLKTIIAEDQIYMSKMFELYIEQELSFAQKNKTQSALTQQKSNKNKRKASDLQLKLRTEKTRHGLLRYAAV